jgi:RNA polymerase sigma factor (sigma-70 family)
MPFAAQAVKDLVNQMPLAHAPRAALSARVMAFPAPTAPALTTSDELLLEVARTHNRRAFAALFDHFAPRLNGFMRKLGSDGPQAEELVQETMLQVWRKAESFDPSKSSAATWIFTIARNKRIDMIRREKRPEYDPHEPALQPPEPVGSAEQMEQTQQSAAIAKAIATLPAEQADLLRLAYFEDKAHGEIAKARQLPLGTVKSRLRLALEKMRRQLNSGDV